MKTIVEALSGVLVLEPKVFGDERGFFFESFNQRTFEGIQGDEIRFVQDNHSRSARGVLRGMHYQVVRPQGKLVRVISGAVVDVAVDLRRSSPSFGKWFSQELSADNKLQMWVPPGFAHGFIVISETADFLYKTTDYWYPEFERVLRWDDPIVNIKWPTGIQPTLAAKDAAGLVLEQAEAYE
jgi:dTDP-4-dehydrorhamnose 3,5-epimerase